MGGVHRRGGSEMIENLDDVHYIKKYTGEKAVLEALKDAEEQIERNFVKFLIVRLMENGKICIHPDNHNGDFVFTTFGQDLAEDVAESLYNIRQIIGRSKEEESEKNI